MKRSRKYRVLAALFCLIFCVYVLPLTVYADAEGLEEETAGEAIEETTQETAEEATPEEAAEATVEDATDETVAVDGSVTGPSVLLMEASTGKVIKEQDADVRRSPASVTKVMTLLLIFEKLSQGRMALSDIVTTSAHAKSMGGSQVFLEEGENQSVETLIKCIAVASGNDASVAMAEYVAGSEEEFVNLMNEKAAALGMENTHFVDCCGLTDSPDHYTTARDVAVMSRELITKYPDIFHYTTIWMEDITHTTARGSSNFTLSSTNKLLKQYEWTTGLKTGFTSKAKYCITATAQKDGIDLIAVIMGADTKEVRNQTAIELLNYGYSVSALYLDANQEELSPIPVEGGVEETVPIYIEEAFRYLDTEGNDLNQVEKTIQIPDKAFAPVKKGDVAGRVNYTLAGKDIGSVCVLYGADVEKAFFKDYLRKIMGKFLL